MIMETPRGLPNLNPMMMEPPGRFTKGDVRARGRSSDLTKLMPMEM
jgi:hypothetical protein